MKPTKEQEQAIDFSNGNQSFKISAYAGAGKTTTLKLIGQSLNRSGTYLAFNKEIAEDARQKFPENVQSQTFHAMAYKETPKFLKEKLSHPRLMPNHIINFFNFSPCNLPLEKNNNQFAVCTSYDQAMILVRALDNFCRSTDSEPTYEHSFRAMPDWADKGYCHDLAYDLVYKVHQLWELQISKNYKYKISHDVYLKHWALQDPEINSSFILFDEAQDADPVMLDILSKQNTQKIYVGDRHQQIYGFRGAINAMQSLDLPEVYLTQSFRFGGRISDIANVILKHLLNESKPLRGNDSIRSTLNMTDKSQAYLARTNAGALATGLKLLTEGHRPKLNLNMQSLLKQVKDSEKLQNNLSVDKNSEFFGFSNWNEVLDYVEAYPKSDLVPIVALIEGNSTQYLINIINKIAATKSYDCMVSTAHRAKGLEFETVELGDDFFWSRDQDELIMTPSEARLLYVACTRAINNLDISRMIELFKELKKRLTSTHKDSQISIN
ncbi:UvrD-helicase domain-containing protein [Acinetobacter pollinis]|uniref:UvrD-helicase domain-containing protein n=1 Tax=Acinetobacter pollinis TaxID=2605270 RepID=UPI0018A316D5|nr:UvrD-helicase domain-containing protein [Acinetobacter pollinis]MBF7691694.1 ATP-dependent helicase [Acinetobacter pollinis]MBF7699270.1 ATP-dependent helicase [Acinetobacter pollinis]